MERKVKVKLHGYLRGLYPEELILSGNTPAEVINGMCRQTKAFDVGPGQDRHAISVVGFPTKESLYNQIPSDVKELHIMPAFTGGKGGGFFKVIIGVVIVASVFLTGGASLAAGSLTFSSTLASVAFNFGVSLILGGLLELVSPAPKIDKSGNSASDPEASKYLGANQNTVKIGTRIPLLYGECLAYGHYISFDVAANDVAL